MTDHKAIDSIREIRSSTDRGSANRVSRRTVIGGLGATLVLPATRGNTATDSRDKVLYNGRIVTVDDSFSVAEAVAIRDGKFLSVGSNEAVRAAADQDAELTNLDGRTVLPGFIDSHNHFFWVSQSWGRTSLAGAQTVQDVLNVIESACLDAGLGNWVVTSDIDFVPETQLAEGRAPSREELDSISHGCPVILKLNPLLGICNSLAFELGGVTADTPDPWDGIIARDLNGELAGTVSGHAFVRIAELVPPMPRDQSTALLKSAMARMNRIGVTGVLDTFVDVDNVSAYRRLWEDGEMTVRSKIWLSGSGELHGPLTDEQVALGPRGMSQLLGLGENGDDMLRIDGLKAIIDGGFAGLWFRGMEPPMGNEYLEAMRARWRLIGEHGWRLGVHTVGDAAFDELLDIFEAINNRTPIVDKHWVIVHGVFPRPEHIERMNALGLRVALQTAFSYANADSFIQTLGVEMTENQLPIRTYMEGGLITGGGTDAPANGDLGDWDPLALIQFAVTRVSRSGTPIGVSQAISREDAIRHHTIYAAQITDDEDKLGSIEPGKLADLVVVSDDILTCPETEIGDARVLMTMLEGDVVYGDPLFAGVSAGSLSDHA